MTVEFVADDMRTPRTNGIHIIVYLPGASCHMNVRPTAWSRLDENTNASSSSYVFFGKGHLLVDLIDCIEWTSPEFSFRGSMFNALLVPSPLWWQAHPSRGLPNDQIHVDAAVQHKILTLRALWTCYIMNMQGFALNPGPTENPEAFQIRSCCEYAKSFPKKPAFTKSVKHVWTYVIMLCIQEHWLWTCASSLWPQISWKSTMSKQKRSIDGGD